MDGPRAWTRAAARRRRLRRGCRRRFFRLKAEATSSSCWTSHPYRRRSCRGVERPRPLDGREAFEKIRHEIALVLAARRQAHERVRQPELRALFRRDRRVRHPRGMTDERLDAAEALAEREEPARRHERYNFLDGAVELERDHAAEAGHLPLGDVMPRM